VSRAVFLNMSERAVIAHCEAGGVGISAIRTLPTGGTRLVCMSVEGAARIRRDLEAKLMHVDPALQGHGPGFGFVPRN
jgi:hypothetical protein